MSVIDIVFGVFILILSIRGMIRGIVREVFGLAALIVGLIASDVFGKHVGQYISSHITITPAIAYAVGFFGIFLIVYIVLLLVGYVISSILKKIELGWLDRLLGFLFGSAKALFFIGVLVFLFESFPFLKPFNKEFTKDSKVYSFVENNIVNKMDIMRVIDRLKIRNISRVKGNIFIVVGGKNA